VGYEERTTRDGHPVVMNTGRHTDEVKTQVTEDKAVASILALL